MISFKPWILILSLSGILTACPNSASTTGDVAEDSSSAEVDNPSQKNSEKPFCTRSGQIDCITNRQFTAMAAFDDNVDVTNLSSENFQEVLKSEAFFEFWDSLGGRHEGKGSELLVAENIKQGVSVLGVTGSLGAAAFLCRYQTQASCAADTACQWSNGTCGLDPWNIRNGKTIAGVNGQLPTNCWTSVGACGSSVWKDVTADGACDSATDDCVMQDRINGLMFSESYPRAGTAPGNSDHIVDWYLANAICENSSFANYTDWRMPTQKEMHEAFNHGIRDLGYKGSGAVRGTGTLDNNDAFIGDIDGRIGVYYNMGYWSGTTVPGQSSDAFYIDFDGGPYIVGYMKYNYAQVLCVRP